MTEKDILTLIDIIIKEAKDVAFFPNKCNNTASFLADIANKIHQTNDSNIIKQNDLLNISEILKKLLNIISALKNKDQFFSFINSDNPIQKPITDINICLNRIIDILNSYNFLSTLKMPKENPYPDFQKINFFLSDSKYHDNELIQQRRKEIIENYKQIQTSESDNIMVSSDEDNFLELTKFSNFKVNSDEIIVNCQYFSSQLYDFYSGQKKLDPKERLRIMVLHDKSKFKRLFSILTKIRHPYLESFVGASIEDSTIKIITRKEGVKLQKCLSYIEHGYVDFDIDDNEEDFIYLEPGDLTLIAFKIAQGIAYLHSHGIIHRNLNTSNIYIKRDENNEVYPIITNFANSHLLSRNPILSKTNFRSDLQKSAFVAPELTDTPNYNEKVDVFAFSGILFQLLTNHPPFEIEINKGDDICKEIKRGKRPTLPKDCSSEIKNLIESCWKQKPSERPSFNSIIDALLPQKDDKIIVFPYDAKELPKIKKIYEKYLISSISAKECLETFERINCSIGFSIQYRFEFYRAQPIISYYQYEFRESKYPREKELTTEENEKIAILIKNLKSLLETVLNSSKENWEKNAHITQVDLPTNQLIENMNLIYESMQSLGINVVDKYQEVENDLIFDYRQLFNDFENCIEKIKQLKNEFDNSSPQIKQMDDDIKSFHNRKKEVIKFLKSRNLLGKKTKEVLISQLKDLFAQFSQFEKKEEDYAIVHLISQGMSSNVYEGREISQEKETKVAIKVLKEEHLRAGEVSLISVSREIANLTRIKHEYIANFIGYVIPKNEVAVWFISEYLSGGSLNDNFLELNSFHKIKIAFEIAEAMEAIHSKNILHRDLTPSNILLDSNLTPKLIDFGYSRSEINDIAKTCKAGTDKYMAPEVSKGSDYGQPADVYSFALILWQLENESEPPDNKKLTFDSGCPAKLKDLILKCSNEVPKKRLSFTEIIRKMISDTIVFSDANEYDEDINKFYDEKREKRRKMAKDD